MLSLGAPRLLAAAGWARAVPRVAAAPPPHRCFTKKGTKSGGAGDDAEVSHGAQNDKRLMDIEKSLAHVIDNDASDLPAKSEEQQRRRKEIIDRYARENRAMYAAWMENHKQLAISKARAFVALPEEFRERARRQDRRFTDPARPPTTTPPYKCYIEHEHPVYESDPPEPEAEATA